MADPVKRYCPRCCKPIRPGATLGESAIYRSHDIPELCERCFEDEDAEIDERGTNDLPDVLGRYRENMKAMRRVRRASREG